MKKIAVIGAGLSGLTVAGILNEFADVKVFEKSRGVSGRMSTRWSDSYYFDHGAQFFTIKTQNFKNFVLPLIDNGVISPWDARFVEIEDRNILNNWRWGEDYPHYVGVPGMNSICKFLSQNLEVKLETTLQNVVKIKNGKWKLEILDGDVFEEFDWVIFSMPVEQISNIIPLALNSFLKIPNVKMQGCFSLMLGFNQSLNLDFDAALIRGDDISWLSVNSSKPGRNDKYSLLIHSTNDWADAHINDELELVKEYLVKQTSLVIDQDVSVAEHQVVHGWRYANSEKRIGESHLINLEENIGFCGDWFIHGRIESAYTSGFDLAQNILREL